MSISPVPSIECSSRVLRTRFADQQFTSFVVTVGEENYVITAAHCIKPAPAGGAESLCSSKPTRQAPGGMHSPSP